MINNHREGQMLKIERLRQGKGIKEVANNICSISTLSKIERGKQNPDHKMLVELYKELGIIYEIDKSFVETMSALIEQYFYEMTYQFERKSLNTLKQHDKKLTHSPLSLEWMVIKGLEDNKESVLDILDECTGFMDEELLAWYYLIPRHESKEIALEKRIAAQKILQNSLATLELIWEYWRRGEYSKAAKLSFKAIDYALDEGNTWTLSQVYLILGSIYSCYNIEELMLQEYQKAMNLLKNTNWKDALESMYYNMGATYISLENYNKAREYLGECRREGFSLFHKWALLEIHTGNLEKAKYWIEKMEEHVENDREKNNSGETWNEYEKSYCEEQAKIVEVTKMQLAENPEENPNYIPLLESLMRKFLSEGRYGFMIFHQKSLKEAYVKKRRYKEALALEEIFSRIRSKNVPNI